MTFFRSWDRYHPPIVRVRVVKMGLRKSLVAKTVDLRKAYKQLPIASSSASDAFLCVLEPTSGCPQIFRSSVLPFEARAAVNNFCTVSQALHWLDWIIIAFHWSCFYDDFFITGNSAVQALGPDAEGFLRSFVMGTS